MLNEQRKLAAIVFTDIVGYTALSQSDEARSLRLLKQHNDLVRSALPRHRGREVKTLGDAFLLEFESALDATLCAIDIQQDLRDHNLKVPEIDRINMRIGIHVGDIVHSGSDVLGDAVNIASRIEAVAEPGGVCLTEPVFLQVRNRIPYPLVRLAEQKLKNVDVSITLYRVDLPWLEKSSQPEKPQVSTRIAVLPFENISPDPNDSYFADGLTEELITVLSQIKGLRVIAKTSVNRFKGSERGVSHIGNELRVGSILEGSVRKYADKIRVTVQLIDVASEEHVWVNQYDRDLNDIFLIQGDIAKSVSEGLRITLAPGEEKRVEHVETENAGAHVAYLKGRSLLHDRTEQTIRSAQEQFELAVKHDSTYARAYVGLADVHALLGEYYYAPASECQEKSRSYLKMALDLDPNLPEAQISLALQHAHDYLFTDAEREFKHAISLMPSYATGHHWYGVCLRELGRFKDALAELLYAEELDPLSPVISYMVSDLYLCVGNEKEFLKRLQRLREIDPEGTFTQSALLDYSLVKSNFEQALVCCQKLKEAWPSNPGLDSNFAFIYAVTNRRKEAEEILGRMVRDLEKGAAISRWEITWIYIGLDDLDECFKWLEKGLEARELPRFFGTIRSFPLCEKVRKDRRFNELLRHANLPPTEPS